MNTTALERSVPIAKLPSDLPDTTRKRYCDLVVGEEIMAHAGNRQRRCRVAKAPYVESSCPSYVILAVHYSRRPESLRVLRFLGSQTVEVFPDQIVKPLTRTGQKSRPAVDNRKLVVDYKGRVLNSLSASNRPRTVPEVVELLKADYPSARFSPSYVRSACNELSEEGLLRVRKQGTRLIYAPLLSLKLNDAVVENQHSPNARYGWVEQFLDYSTGEGTIQLPIIRFLGGMRCLSNAAMLDRVLHPQVLKQIEIAKQTANGGLVALPEGTPTVPWYLLTQLRWQDKGRAAFDEEVVLEIAKHLGWIHQEYMFQGRSMPWIHNKVMDHLDLYYPDWRTLLPKQEVPEYVMLNRCSNGSIDSRRVYRE